MFKNILKDLDILSVKYNLSKAFAIISNRRFHTLLFYRFSHALFNLT